MKAGTTKALRWIALLLLAMTPAVAPTLRWFDRNWLHGQLKDTWGAVRSNEDWATAQALPAGLDRAWLHAGPRPLRIAHALGASGSADGNSLAAMHLAMRGGFRLFEVDIWLGPRGELRCYHGPEAPPPPKPGDCTLEQLFPLVEQANGWIILDIKTDFRQTGQQIVRLLKAHGWAQRAIFQLYLPEHTALFNGWARELPLPEPIVTAYLSRRSLGHIVSRLPALHVQAFTVPLDNLPSLPPLPDGITLLVHPVHSCDDLARARTHAAAGIYTLNGSICSP